MEIQTPRFRLVPFSAENLLALIQGYDEFARSFGNRAANGLRDFLVSGDVSQDFLDNLRSSSGTDPWTQGFAVVEGSTDSVIGTAGFKGPPDDEGIVEIAYGIVPDFEGQGVATEAAGSLVKFASGDSRIRMIRAHTLPESNASTRVLTKNGFVKIAELVDPDDGPVWRWERGVSK